MNGKPLESEPAGKSNGDNTRLEFIKFALVGVMNTAVDFLVFTLLIWVGVNYLAAQTVSYGAGTLNSYIVNKSWTFRGKGQAAGSRRIGSEVVRFVTVNLGALLLSLVLLYLLKNRMHVPAMTAKLLVTTVTVLVNYAGSKLWVFR